ncbi:diaminopimelate decarboxylase [Candidatus Woesearchaeota archaeon]|jgi:diaminopimelate decarboxylase|nr:diaminopimelate decarboxylase [Candidatus Woesearchaeota archaeon]
MNSEKLIEAAQKFKTPLYVYDGNLIKTRYRELNHSLNCATDVKTKLFYAMKANYNPSILKLLLNEGAGIDAVSPAEVMLALEVGFFPNQILFTANKITDEEMRLVKSTGVLFNIGSISRLKKYCKEFPKSSVCIRFNPMIVAGETEKVRTGGENSKFGIFISQLDQVLEITRSADVKIVGVHEHTGSGIPEMVQMKAGMQNLLDIVTPKNFPDLIFVDFGGGFKVPYTPGEEKINYDLFGKDATQIFLNRTKDFYTQFNRRIEMWFEPGKYLVAESGNLLVEVTAIKHNPHKTFAGTNSGFPQLIRPMFYQAYHHIINLTANQDNQRRNNCDEISKQIHQYDIVGNICESGDCFGVNREMEEIHEGDILSIQTAGAYCYSMGSVYNLRVMPAEVMFLNNSITLIRKRLTEQELVAQIIGECSTDTE